MKTQDEIQRAHDMIVAILTGLAPKPDDVCGTALLQVAAVLCWSLGHDHPPAQGFKALLEQLEVAAADVGLKLERRR